MLAAVAAASLGLPVLRGSCAVPGDAQQARLAVAHRRPAATSPALSWRGRRRGRAGRCVDDLVTAGATGRGRARPGVAGWEVRGAWRGRGAAPPGPAALTPGGPVSNMRPTGEETPPPWPRTQRRVKAMNRSAISKGSTRAAARC